jgi:membrane-bound metal-dependent hydrolase YbcI (DUF457 family)
MDPVSHAAFARTLIDVLDRSPAARGHSTVTVPVEWPRRRFVAAAVLGALSPDLDLVIMPFGWDRYLRVHEVGTHTVVGTLACALLTAAVVHLFARPTRYSSLAFSAWIGAASHVALDLLSGARLRPAWPLVDAVASVPLVAMADPWLLALCVTGAAASWIGGGSRRRRAGVAALAVTAVFLLAKAALGLVAVANYRNASERSGEVVLARVVEAEWADLNRWHVFDRTARHLRSWSTGGGGVQELFSWPLEPESPSVARSRSFSTVRNFLRAHELGFAATLPRGEGGTLVLWSDIRFCWDAARPEARRLEPVVQSATGNRRIACALWFGGELDAAGRPRLEVVKVGGFTQSRAPSP